MSGSRKWLFAGFAVGAGLLVALVVCEVALRIYNPVPFRIRGTRIRLPVNVQLEIDNAFNPRLDRQIVHRRNSLGFRGADPPADLDRHLSVIAIGGSTTECFYLSDDDTWPARLGSRLDRRFRDVWINNAGLDGHSTFGHIQLLDQVVAGLSPKVILLLTGVNDVGRRNANDFDRGVFDADPPSGPLWLADHSEVVSLAVNLFRLLRTRRLHGGHAAIDWATVAIVGQDRGSPVGSEEPQAIRDYETRIGTIIRWAQARRITPVLLTQPALYGGGRDPSSGLDLARADIGGGVAGVDAWTRLESYNDTVRQAGAQTGVPVIDMARHLPKDSLYFYDWVHFTKEGADAFADGAAAQLVPVIERYWPAYAR